MEAQPLVLTKRELLEILHSQLYAMHCNHGTTGHNQLLLIDKLAKHLGFEVDHVRMDVVVPDGVVIES